VARDRQRAKQRRRQRQTGAQRPASGRRDLRVGDDDATVENPVLGEGTAAPDPLKNAMPDVDQAHLAEAGAERGLSGDVEGDDDMTGFRDESDDAPAPVRYDPAPDAVEETAAPGAKSSTTPSRRTSLPRPARSRGPVSSPSSATRLMSCARVIWPDRRQVGQATAVVLGFVVIAGGYLGLMDAIFKPLVQAIL
jgi:preprotein translocase SecE subunit